MTAVPLHPETQVLHAGLDKSPTAPVIMPITLSTTFAQPAPGEHAGYDYTRAGNPNRADLEAALATLEGAAHCACFASGCAALGTVFQTLRPGDRITVSADIYGGTYRLLEQVVAPMQIAVDWVQLCGVRDPAGALRGAIGEQTKLVVAESPTNPLLAMLDLRVISEVTRQAGVPLMVDNTFATPLLQRPLDLGADIVAHSTTKFINGHSDVLGGALLTNDDTLAERFRFLQKSFGAVPSPFDCALTMRGLKTLGVRMQRHCENANQVAHFLHEHEGVERVYYPGLASHEGHDIASLQMSGYGSMVSAVIAGRGEGAKRFLERLRLFTLAESLGGVESLVAYPAMMSHAAMPADVRRTRGIADGLVRISVGIEHHQDLIADLAQALSR